MRTSCDQIIDLIDRCLADDTAGAVEAVKVAQITERNTWAESFEHTGYCHVHDLFDCGFAH